VDARGCETDRQGIIMGRKGIQIMYSVGECFDWAEGSGTGCVVHGAATLAILLVVKVKSDRIRRSQFVKWRIMRQDVALFEKPNVLAAELDGAGAGTGTGGRYCISDRAQEEEKGNGK
jgi:hypothetical protein